MNILKTDAHCCTKFYIEYILSTDDVINDFDGVITMGKSWKHTENCQISEISLVHSDLIYIFFRNYAVLLVYNTVPHTIVILILLCHSTLSSCEEYKIVKNSMQTKYYSTYQKTFKHFALWLFYDLLHYLFFHY